MTIRVLIAEDEELQRDIWIRGIHDYNEQHGNEQFEHIFAITQEEAVRILHQNIVHCAAIDLRMPVGSTALGNVTSSAGNAVIQTILEEIGIPAVICSAAIEEASQQVSNSRVKLIEKNPSSVPEALTWLASHSPLIRAMEESQKRLKRISAKIFSSYIWPRWSDAWKNCSSEGFPLTGVIVRHLASHISESIGTEAKPHHPEEFYVRPSMSGPKIATGDLVKQGVVVRVVVTPRCNLSNGHSPNNLILAQCNPLDEQGKSLVQKLQNITSGNRDKILKDLGKYATQGNSIGTHFLPPCGGDGPWLIDFKECISIDSSQAEELIRFRFASISPCFLPNMIQRYAAYVGRIGQPEIDTAALAEYLTPRTIAAR